ncbi:AraC family transcriptional regulator [Paenibacillus sp. HB172176]|uniref:AraC family transcriptional regulator n=1 Tax=Paenibacillus sp. HB172176 TaxID=2493690 RepID=UPI00143BC2D6|nr:AraC family transcriptional regulator [Paenibacillus sp. HB172176]
MTEVNTEERLPPIDIGNLAIKLALEGFILNVLYVKFGYFHSTMREHSHSRGSYELHYIPEGQGILIADGIRYSLMPGTLFMTGPAVLHEQIPAPADPMAEYCIFFEVVSGDSSSCTDKGNGLSSHSLSELLVNTPFWIGQDNENLLPLFKMLSSELSSKPLGFHHMAKNVLEMIVARTVRQYSNLRPSQQHAPEKTMDDSRLLTIENSFLYEYAALTLSELANRLSLSTRQTERIVLKLYGVSFKEKKQQSRMSAAAQLLTTTNLSISGIAARVGFATLEQFSHSFKQFYKITATQFRARNK